MSVKSVSRGLPRLPGNPAALHHHVWLWALVSALLSSGFNKHNCNDQHCNHPLHTSLTQPGKWNKVGFKWTFTGKGLNTSCWNLLAGRLQSLINVFNTHEHGHLQIFRQINSSSADPKQPLTRGEPPFSQGLVIQPSDNTSRPLKRSALKL